MSGRGITISAYLAGLALCFLSALWLISKAHELKLKVVLSSSISGRTQIFWRKNSQDFSENRSQSVQIRGDKKFHTLIFQIPSLSFDEIRFDPIDQNGTVKIQSLKLTGLFGETELKARLSVLNQIRPLTKEGVNLVAGTTGPDSQMLVAINNNYYTIVCLALFSLLLLVPVIISPYIRVFSEKVDIRNKDFYLHLIIILTLILGFFASVALKLHGSSLAAWYGHFPNLLPPNDNLIIGLPHPVRSDEWLVHTPAIISQSKLNLPFAEENRSYGDKATPLLMGLPSRHFTSFFKPQYWGFFLFDLEYAFSWWWNYRVFSCLIGVYLLLRLFTNKDPLLSLTGSLWLYGSGFTQWWLSAGVPEMLGNMSLAVVCLCYVLSGERARSIFCNAVGLLLFGLSFILQIYPPFQIPLAWLSLAILTGLMLDQSFSLRFSVCVKSKIISICLVLAATATCLLYFIGDISESAEVMAKTSYPGQRFEVGGNLSVARLLLGNFSFFLTDKNFPEQLGNISEAASFIFCWPLSFLVLICLMPIRSYRLILPLVFFNIAVLSYCLTGWPTGLSGISLFSFVPASRAQIALGLSNIFLSIIALSLICSKIKPVCQINILSNLKKLITYLIISGIIAAFCITRIETLYGSFFNLKDYLLESVFFLSLCLAIMLHDRIALIWTICLISASNILSINPISSGLDIINNNQISVSADRLPEERHQPMLVYGDFILPALFKAAGFNVLNGAQYIPALNFWSNIDPKNDYFDLYNRYAHFIFEITSDSDALQISLLQADLAKVVISPCNPAVKSAGVKLIVLSGIPPESLNCLQPVSAVDQNSNLAIYKIK